MAFYLIDTDNVSRDWVEFVVARKDATGIGIFFTQHSQSLTYAQLNKLGKINGPKEYIECYAGKNGLDFQLASALGFKIHSDPEESYVIVSRDNGYDPMIKFWNSRGFKVCKAAPELPKKQPRVKVKAEEPKAEEVVEEPVENAAVEVIAEVAAEPATELPTEQEEAAREPSETVVEAALETEVKDKKPARRRRRSRSGKAQQADAQPEAQEPQPEIQPESQPEEPAQEEDPVRAELAGLDPEWAEDVVETLTNCVKTGMSEEKNKRKSKIYNEIISKFGQKKGLAIYKVAKTAIDKMAKK